MKRDFKNKRCSSINGAAEISEAEVNLKTVIKKIARLTMGLLRKLALWLDERWRHHHRISNKTGGHGHWGIRGLYTLGGSL
jgi:hypothetical protein